MYLEHFGLNELPFTIAPNPRYLYLTQQHQEALAHLSYGLGSAGGVILLTGEVGTGKTTISRKLLEDIPEHIDIAWIVSPRLSVEELLASICDELSIAYPEANNSIKIFTDRINAYLIEAHGHGRNVVVMIDEAQNLSPEVLEQLRLLTNLETSERKLLQIILLGQPELKEKLERNDLRQLAQRITARYHLRSLSKEESGEYIRHRLAVAGCNRPVFSSKAIAVLFDFSHGTPRLINLLCDRALLGVYSCNESIVTPEHVRQASKEVLGDHIEVSKRGSLMPFVLVFVMCIGIGVLLHGIWPWFVETYDSHPGVTTSATLMDHTVHEKEIGNAKIAHDPLNTEQLVASALDATLEGDIAADDSAALHSNADETLTEQGLQAARPAEARPESMAAEATPVEPALAQETQQEAGEPVSLFPDNPWEVIEKTGTKELAFQTLAALWDTSISNVGGALCDQLRGKRLLCLQQRTNLWLLREHNRPAIFHIKGSDGQDHYAVIRSIEGDQLVIQLDQQYWDISFSELEQHWQGQFTLFWLKPPGYTKDIQQGDSGPMVQWLAQQMDNIQGEMIPKQTFKTMNAMLAERLKNFQQSEGLPSDGIVGPLTLMRINERIDQSMPRLTYGELF
ncbi:AAA family ATPase [Mariprofundus sp. EBB-1]|uniref:AAA family ATPase n=1 Tax=Mariprofundus sp. EBB-1 TaxID=2650971 RepID=UPI000EF18BB4|nr:AAA family ATPase [Mariprofundus sp. EBB-1]RLL50553.1 AAA family ATPase [Mariprofundus sp. EBB-1]